MSQYKNRKNNNPIDNLVQTLAKMPGLGQRSAVRAVYYMLSHKDTCLVPFLNQLSDVANHVSECQKCYNFAFDNLCPICSDPKRDITSICLVEKPQDIHAIEKAQFYSGTYYVIGGLLSVFNGITPQDLKTDTLLSRIETDNVSEIIFALPATQDGRTTLHYISDKIAQFNIKITMPAQGMPLGSDLDFIDQGTMATAFRGRIGID
jgi:recombination protein RecR